MDLLFSGNLVFWPSSLLTSTKLYNFYKDDILEQHKNGQNN